MSGVVHHHVYYVDPTLFNPGVYQEDKGTVTRRSVGNSSTVPIRQVLEGAWIKITDPKKEEQDPEQEIIRGLS